MHAFRRATRDQDELQLTKHEKVEYAIPVQVSPQDQEVLTIPVQGVLCCVVMNVYDSIF